MPILPLDASLTQLLNRCLRLVTIMREEGPAALYKGFVPKVLRLAPGGGVLLLVVEFTLEVFRKGSSHLLLSPLTISSSHIFPTPVDSPRTSIHLSTSSQIGPKGSGEQYINHTSAANERFFGYPYIPRVGSRWRNYSLQGYIDIKCDTALRALRGYLSV